MDGFDALLATTRQLLSAGGALQSIRGNEQIDRAQLKQGVVRHLARLHPAEPTSLEAAAQTVLDAADRGLDGSAQQGDAAAREFVQDALEVIVQVIGRPALRMPLGKVQSPDNTSRGNELWTTWLGTHRKQVDKAAASVAKLYRVFASGKEEHIGTGWRLGADLIVTNRHVVELLVLDVTLPVADWSLDPRWTCVADFGATDGPATPLRFAANALLACAPECAIDLAVLRLAPNGATLPHALAVSDDESLLGAYSGGPTPTFQGQPVYAVGHPLQRLAGSEVLFVFGDADGRKRCSPGRTTALREGATNFEHDCSTLRGNSGSPIFGLYTHQVLGTHRGGRTSDPEGIVGSANAAVAVSRLSTHVMGEILKNGVVEQHGHT
ncbi:serine protease [Roseateles sp.]|uniref:trypsin-like serine peptidase n=1 Tax=Roseateles sp. TaxID=1971397 RepID=UPI002F402989